MAGFAGAGEAAAAGAGAASAAAGVRVSRPGSKGAVSPEWEASATITFSAAGAAGWAAAGITTCGTAGKCSKIAPIAQSILSHLTGLYLQPLRNLIQ
jgi:hypothetical protein